MTEQPQVDLVEGGRPAGRGRRSARVAVGLTVLAVVGAAAAPTLGSSLRSGTPAAGTPAVATPLAAPAAGLTCPKSQFVDVDGGTEYAVAFNAEIQDLKLYSGWIEVGQIWGAAATNISAVGCGLLRIPSLQAVIQPDDLVFDTSKADILTQTWDPIQRKPIPLFGPGEVAIDVTPKGTSTADVSGVLPLPDGRLSLKAFTPAELVVKPGPTNPGSFRCVTLAKTTLTTGKSTVRPVGRGPRGPKQDGVGEPWTVEGKPLDGALVGATSTVVGNDFPVPVFDPFADFTCVLFNPAFAGTGEDGNDYYNAPPGGGVYGPNHPPGVAQTIGKLVVTQIDEGALAAGPPDVVPGTS